VVARVVVVVKWFVLIIVPTEDLRIDVVSGSCNDCQPDQIEEITKYFTQSEVDKKRRAVGVKKDGH